MCLYIYLYPFHFLKSYQLNILVSPHDPRNLEKHCFCYYFFATQVILYYFLLCIAIQSNEEKHSPIFLTCSKEYMY